MTRESLWSPDSWRRKPFALNEAFLTHTREKRPFGILKIAMTLDGKIATANGESQWITSEESRASVQGLRHTVDAVITGSGTFLKDKPQLTDRTGLPRRRELLRVVLDRRERVEKTPGWVLIRGGFDLLREEMNQRQIQSFVLECGPDLAFSALEAGIIDKIVAFIAPRSSEAVRFPRSVAQVSSDFPTRFDCTTGP